MLTFSQAYQRLTQYLSHRRRSRALAKRTSPALAIDPRTRRHFNTIDFRQIDTLRVFHEVAKAITSNIELDPLLRTILGKMEDFFGPEQWSLLMLDEETQELYYAITVGIDEEITRDLRIPINEGFTGQVARTGQALIVPDVHSDPQWSEFAASRPDLELYSIACLPIAYGRTMHGVLQLHNAKLSLLPDNSLSFLRVVCDYTAIALQNAAQVKKIHHLSITDDCTGLFNARHLYHLLNEEIATVTNPKVRPLHPHFSLVFLDLDRFKSVNDTHGHQVGSQLLADVGALLKRVIGPRKEPQTSQQHAGFRYGGDEFVVLLRGLDKTAATAFAQDILQQLRESPFTTADGHPLPITASLGVATFPQDGATLQAIIRSADAMMYAAKAHGRNRVEVADSEKPQPALPIKTSRHS